jgi:LacI family transcriptional regulator
MEKARRRATSKDVAARAGVSRTTVSFVLNDVRHANISDETRQRVLQAAETLGYVPHAAARALAGGKTGTIGLLLRPLRMASVDAFLHQLIHGLMAVCLERGYRLLVETAAPSSPPESYLHMVRDNQIDALVVLGIYEEDPALTSIIASGFPVVLVGHFDDPIARIVFTDNRVGIASAVDHLLTLGHRRFGFIHFVPLPTIPDEPRLDGYVRALAAAGIPLEPGLVLGGGFSAASGYAAMRHILSSGNPPTALVAGNDTIAIGAMTAIREAGLRIPNDVAVTGYDDIPMARFAVPPLTTVGLPTHDMGRAAGELAIAAIEGDPAHDRIRTFNSRLIVRHSCGLIPVSQTLDE